MPCISHHVFLPCSTAYKARVINLDSDPKLIAMIFPTSFAMNFALKAVWLAAILKVSLNTDTEIRPCFKSTFNPSHCSLCVDVHIDFSLL